MTAAELLTSLQQRGLTLAVGDKDTLTLAPKGQVTPEVRELVRAHKTALLTLLRPQFFDDIRSGVKRLEKELAVGEDDLDWFMLIIHDDETPAPPDLDQRIREQARARGLRGRQLLIVWSSRGYDPWASGQKS